MLYTTQQLRSCYDFIKVNLANSLMLCCVCLMIIGCQSNMKPSDNLPDNFYKISDDLSRSEQPTRKQIQYLEKLGFKTIINLRLLHSDRDKLENTDLSEVWIKIRAGNISDEKIIEILKAINQSPKPILIHCWHGSDRTGVAVAMYRIVFQNWSKSQAINELMKPEFGHHYNVYPNIVKYIENVDIEKIRAAVFQ